MKGSPCVRPPTNSELFLLLCYILRHCQFVVIFPSLKHPCRHVQKNNYLRCIANVEFTEFVDAAVAICSS